MKVKLYSIYINIGNGKKQPSYTIRNHYIRIIIVIRLLYSVFSHICFCFDYVVMVRIGYGPDNFLDLVVIGC